MRGAAQANKPLLEIEDLWIEGLSDDGWRDIVKGVSLTLNRGEILGLIGESGAGKSTLGLAAMGFTREGCRIKKGRIGYEELDLVRAPEERRRRLRGVKIAYVAQSAAASFNPAYRLMTQVTETAVQHRVMSRAEATNEAVDLFERIRLPDPNTIGFRYPHQVSGGQLQRAMTAMAMLCRPDLIIFDEPTTALDVTTQVEVLASIRDIVEQFRTAAIYITHDLAVVAQMADRIKVLRHGTEVEEADTATMLSNPQQEYTRSLWAVRTFRKESAPDTANQRPLLEVKGVTASYGSAPVLENVSFEIFRRQTVAVVGESGSGKSTTARVITGLLPPLQGEIVFDGEVMPPSFRQRSKKQLRQVQMIYQMPDTALNPKQRVRDVIGRPLELHLGLRGKQRDERVRELLRLIDMEPAEFLDRLPSELSGGQKQRICIARALAADPILIICDEVTSALDQLVAERILKLLDRLQQELDLCYMFITHDLATVKAIADEVVVMLKGRVVEKGPKERMFRPPHHEYTEVLLSSVPEMDPGWLDRLLEERERRGRLDVAAGY